MSSERSLFFAAIHPNKGICCLQSVFCSKYYVKGILTRWSVFFRILAKYGELHSKSPHSIRLRENKEQKKNEFRHFSRGDIF